MNPHDPQLLHDLLLLGSIQVVVGAIGLLTRRGLPLLLISAGILVQGAVLTLVAFSTFHATWPGQILALCALAVAAVQMGLAVPLIRALAMQARSLDVSWWRTLGDPEAGDQAEAPPRTPPDRPGAEGSDA